LNEAVHLELAATRLAVDGFAYPNWKDFVGLFSDNFMWIVVDVFHSFTLYCFLIDVQPEDYEEVETDHDGFNTHLDSCPHREHLYVLKVNPERSKLRTVYTK
jgi:hypothetical protein